MKKILLLMAIILPFVLTSCDDDKDEPKSLEQQLIGSWVQTQVDGPNTLTWHYIFNSDHNGKQQIILMKLELRSQKCWIKTTLFFQCLQSHLMDP